MGKFFLVVFIFYSTHVLSQNLVPNASFEDTIVLIPYGAVEYSCMDWYAPGGFIPDYFHIEYNLIETLMNNLDIYGYPNLGVPINYFTLKTYPRTGVAYAGLELLFYGTYHDTLHYLHFYLDNCFDREILGVNLKTKLIKDHCYKVQFYVSTAFRKTSFATDAIDVFFSPLLGFRYTQWQQTHSDSIDYLENCNCGAIYSGYNYFTPQLSTTRGHFFTDTLGWEKVEFEYKANGTEVQMNIGNLRPHLCEDADFIQFEVSQFWDSGHYNSVYLFYDDVSVYPCDSPEFPADIGIKDTCINIGSPIVLGGMPKEEYLYWWYNSHDSLISRQSSITVYPTQDTSFVLVQKDFKFDETRDTVHIKVGICTDYSGYDFAIYPNPNNGDFQVRFNTAVPDGAVLELYDLLGRKLAEYPLSGSDNIANINGIEVASAIYYATVVVPNVFRKSVKMVIMK